LSLPERTFRIELLAGSHDRESFACGNEALDRYIRTHAGQDMRRHLATCFVLTSSDGPGRILGFYTLAAASIDLHGLPEPLAKRLPRYPRLPATLLGRLAVSLEQQGQRLGEILLFDAMARALSSEIASFAVTVDPTDDAARRFYERYRFLPLGLEERRLFLPMSEIAQLFS
jgi:ribosomal protein S18 acetylase RimI-like enzyme